jgi:hypothetical protein
VKDTAGPAHEYASCTPPYSANDSKPYKRTYEVHNQIKITYGKKKMSAYVSVSKGITIRPF